MSKLGRILRNYGLDELPILINIIKVDMSIVGSRPLPC
ncbi:MAG: sugar transferase [bacterium]